MTSITLMLVLLLNTVKGMAPSMMFDAMHSLHTPDMLIHTFRIVVRIPASVSMEVKLFK